MALVVQTIQLAAAQATGIALSQAVAGAQNLTINGALASGGVATMDVARRIIITSAGNDAAVVFTVTGTDRRGQTQSEKITGVTTTPVQSVLDYKTITSIASSGATANNISAGTNTVGSTDWFAWDAYRNPWALSGVCIGPAATTYTLESTWDDPNKMIGVSLVAPPYQWSTEAQSYIPPNAIPHQVINAVAGTNAFQFPNDPRFATRLTINTGTGLVSIQYIQPGP